MSKGAPNRYQSAAEMRTDLVRVLSGQRPLAPMVMTDEDRTTILRQGRTAAAAAARPAPPGRARRRLRRLRPVRGRGGGTQAPAPQGLADRAAHRPRCRAGRRADLADEQRARATSRRTSQVEVPNVIGQLLEDARSELSRRASSPEVKYQICEPTATSEPGSAGRTLSARSSSTNPAPGTKMNKSDPLTLVVGEAPDKVDGAGAVRQDAGRGEGRAGAGRADAGPDRHRGRGRRRGRRSARSSRRTRRAARRSRRTPPSRSRSARPRRRPPCRTWSARTSTRPRPSSRASASR